MTKEQFKVLIFILFTLIASVFFWWQTLNIFQVENIQISDLIYFGTSFLVFLVFLLLQFILTEVRGTAYFAIFLLGLISILIYLWRFGVNSLNYYYLVSVLISLILLMIAYELMGLEREDRLRLSLGKIWQRGLPIIVIALSLIISIIYYFHPLLKFSQDKIELPLQLMKWLMKPMGPMFSKVLPFYDPKMTIDEMLAASLAMTGGEEGLDIKSLGPEILAKIPAEKLMTMGSEELLKDPEIKALIKQQLVKKSKGVDQRLIAQQREDFAKSLGIKLTGKETMDEVINKLINARLGEFIGPYYKQISIGIAIIFFFLLRFIFGLLGIIAIILARIFFTLLRRFKVVEVVLVTKEGETLKL